MDAQNHETSTQKGKLDEPFSNGIHHLNRENMRGLTLFVGGCTYFQLFVDGPNNLLSTCTCKHQKKPIAIPF
jgi:hypothetical protein